MLDLIEFIKEMRATSSSTEKTAIIAQSNAFIHNVLEATYNPYKQYYVTSKTCKKNSGLFKYNTYETIFELLDDLSSRKITGHDAIAAVNGFVIANCDTIRLEDIIYSIIDKDLKIRCGAKVINKAKPNLIPEFNVALAQEYKGKCDWQNEDWYASRKLDGVRCLAVVDFEGKCTLYSRMGKELTTLNKVKEAIEKTGIINTVFDGEICLMDENGNEDFQGVMKELRRKDHQIDNPIFMIFDMIHKPDFDSGKSTEILSDRLHKLRSFLTEKYIDLKDPSDHINNTLRYLDQYVITDGRHFDMWGQMAGDNNWEGFMLRKDCGYEGKRSKNLVKVKKFHDAEYEVLDFDVDNHEVVRDGKSETIEMLSQVWIEHKGHRVKVGSGWTQEQRLQYMDGSIVGKTITVQYFEETTNDKGGISLRFPTIKIVHGEKREM
jgi:DNA ligase-1